MFGLWGFNPQRHTYLGDTKFLHGEDDGGDDDDDEGPPKGMVVKQVVDLPVQPSELSYEKSLELAIAQSELEKLA
jgi:hypothetical protein